MNRLFKIIALSSIIFSVLSCTQETEDNNAVQLMALSRSAERTEDTTSYKYKSQLNFIYNPKKYIASTNYNLLEVDNKIIFIGFPNQKSVLFNNSINLIIDNDYGTSTYLNPVTKETYHCDKFELPNKEEVTITISKVGNNFNCEIK